MSAGSCASLLEAIDAIEIGACGDDLAEALRALDRLQAKVTVAVGEFDRYELFELDAATSTTAWLRGQGMTAGSAASLARTAKRLQQLPVTRSAWLDGSLSGGQVQAITANVDDATVDLFASQEADLVPLLAPLDVLATTDVMRQWKAHADALVDRPEPKRPSRSAHLSPLLDGRWRLDADLDVEGGEIVRLGLQLASTPDGAGESRSPAEHRGDALIDVFRFFLDHQDITPSGARHRPHVNVVIDLEALEEELGGRIVSGGFLDGPTIRRMLCDCKLNRVLTDGPSVILDYGTSTRLFSPAQFQALVLRDQHCRHHGCDRPPAWCQAHHVVPWNPRSPGEPRGPTDISNGVLKCDRHHHIGHLPGWSEKLEPDGTYHLTAPDGRTWTTTPPGVSPRLAFV